MLTNILNQTFRVFNRRVSFLSSASNIYASNFQYMYPSLTLLSIQPFSTDVIETKTKSKKVPWRDLLKEYSKDGQFIKCQKLIFKALSKVSMNDKLQQYS